LSRPRAAAQKSASWSVPGADRGREQLLQQFCSSRHLGRVSHPLNESSLDFVHGVSKRGSHLVVLLGGRPLAHLDDCSASTAVLDVNLDRTVAGIGEPSPLSRLGQLMQQATDDRGFCAERSANGEPLEFRIVSIISLLTPSAGCSPPVRARACADDELSWAAAGSVAKALPWPIIRRG
jgi:hypothetical protein